MKRLLFSAFAIIVAMCGANAQDMFDSGNNRARLGVRVAWDLNSPSTDLNKIVNLYNSGSGFSMGAVYDIPLYKNLYFEPGLCFFYNTISIDDVTILNSPGMNGYVIDGSLRNAGFRVPFTVGYRFDFTDDISLSAFTGPQFNVGLSLKEHLVKTSSLYGNGWSRFDAQWLIGVRFHYIDNWFADISGGIGLTNMLTGDLVKKSHFRRNTFSIGVGYLF